MLFWNWCEEGKVLEIRTSVLYQLFVLFVLICCFVLLSFYIHFSWWGVLVCSAVFIVLTTWSNLVIYCSNNFTFSLDWLDKSAQHKTSHKCFCLVEVQTFFTLMWKTSSRFIARCRKQMNGWYYLASSKDFYFQFVFVEHGLFMNLHNILFVHLFSFCSSSSINFR